MKQLSFLSYFDVLEACALPGCPFCQLSEKVVNRYLDALMYEQVNDPYTREMLHRSFGFCNEHAWRLPDTGAGAPLGVALIYRDLIGRIADELHSARYVQPNKLTLTYAQEILDRDKTTAATESAVRRLRPPEKCPACVHRDMMETIALKAMLEALPDDERMQTALQSSGGLCLPHLRRAFELAREEAAFNALRRIAQEKLAALRGELSEFIRKNDYRFNKEGFGPEGDSWRRAIGWIVGW